MIMKNNINQSITVVIASLGGDCLYQTIFHLNQGSLIPDEILICVPEECAHKIDFSNSFNVRVISTPFRGQVAQRAFGFNIANGDLVMQLDDDISLHENCMSELVKFILMNPRSAVAPMLYDNKSRLYHSSHAPKNMKSIKVFERILFFSANGFKGYQPGKISLSGVGMGLPEEPGSWDELDWLPG
jgi:hypothetical protein